MSAPVAACLQERQCGNARVGCRRGSVAGAGSLECLVTCELAAVKCECNAAPAALRPTEGSFIQKNQCTPLEKNHEKITKKSPKKSRKINEESEKKSQKITKIQKNSQKLNRKSQKIKKNRKNRCTLQFIVKDPSRPTPAFLIAAVAALLALATARTARLWVAETPRDHRLLEIPKLSHAPPSTLTSQEMDP